MKLVLTKCERTITMSTLFLFFRVPSSCYWQIVQTAYGDTRSRFFLTPKMNAFVTRFADTLLIILSISRVHDADRISTPFSMTPINLLIRKMINENIKNFFFTYRAFKLVHIWINTFERFNYAFLKKTCVHRVFQSLYYVAFIVVAIEINRSCFPRISSN